MSNEFLPEHASAQQPAGGSEPLSLSRRSFFVFGGLTAGAIMGIVAAPRAFATNPQLDIDFESGALGDPITHYAGAFVAPEYAYSGSYGCRLDPTATTDGIACLVVDQKGFTLGMPYVTFSMRFRLATLPSVSDKYMNLFEIGTTATTAPKSQFTVFFRNDRLTCDFDWSESLDIAAAPTDSTWHVIQAIVFYGGTTYTAKVSYDGGATKTLVSASDKTAQSVKTLWIHYPRKAVDYTIELDEIQMATSATEPDFLGSPPPQPPPPPPPPATGVTFSESFEGGAPGTQPTSANTAYDETIGDRGDGNGTVAVSFDSGGVRGQCARFHNTQIARPTFGFLGKRVGPQTTLYLRRYYKLDALPGYRTSVLLYKFGGNGNGQLGGTHNGSLAFGGTGQSHKFALVNNNAVARLSQASVPLNAWFRVEVELDFSSGTGVQTARLFLGANVDGVNADETLSGALTGTYTDYVEDGILTNPNALINVRIDEVANGTDWIGAAP